jgi:hypothetical protein
MRQHSLKWLSFHRVRFSEPVNRQDRAFDGPQTAGHWHFGPFGVTGENGLRTGVSEVWGGFGGYATREQAEAVIDDPQSHLLFLSEAVESWHALLLPVKHHGEVNWFSKAGTDCRIEIADDDPGGPLAVITSAGFNFSPGMDLARPKDFIANVDRVGDWFETLDANIVHTTFGGRTPDIDGITFTIWKDDRAMMESTYMPGIHRTQLDRYKSEHTADRSSFTRARILRSAGRWGDDDPVSHVN